MIKYIMPATKISASKRKIIFVTGLSGAGMTSALKVLEDFGYEVFDNFPLSFIEHLAKEKGHEDSHVAFGLDTRARGFSPEDVVRKIETLRKNRKNDVQLLFMNAGNTTLQKRYSETRRSHPLAKDRPVLDGIRQERGWLKTLMERADLLVDTTDLSIHDLRRLLQGSVHPDPAKKKLAVTVMSFGFKNGVPRESDMVLDVRFLKNPHWDAKLRPLTGKDKKVQAYIQDDADYAAFLKHTKEMLKLLLPRYADEGKYYFTLAVGCTGGKHRSVHLAEELAADIKKGGYTTTLRHRDLE